MYSLPRNTRIVFRDPDKGMSKIAHLYDKKWQGKRLTVVLADHFDVLTNNEFWFSYNLVTGAHETLTLPSGEWDYQARRRQAQRYDVLEELAFVTAVSRDRTSTDIRTSDVLVYIKAWVNEGDAELCGALSIMRDAIFEAQGRPSELADAVGKTHLPHSYALLNALFRREFELLQIRHAQARDDAETI